jgi:Holliday junction resolvase RusA-like endonuclease
VVTHEQLASITTPAVFLLGAPVFACRTLTFSSYGLAKPQGSQESRFVPSLGRAIAHEKRPVLDWRRDVARAAGAALPAGYELMRGAVELLVVFYRPRPRSWPRRRVFQTSAPDADKLARAIGDALKGVVYADDAQIVALLAFKAVGEPARADVLVRELAPEGH